ncbi:MULTISPECIES: methionine/alanine import family NSS transporter small subunit [Psychrobacter]|nr:MULTISPECIES: methionine/alanine import family NSS transporter small subunit [Psychrobacter]
MNSSAIVLMMVSILLVWGGLVMAIIHLMKHPDLPLDHINQDLP